MAQGFRVSPTQEWLWRWHGPQPGGYVSRCVARLDTVDPGAVRDALRMVVARHEALRTVLVVPAAGDLPVMLVRDVAGAVVPVTEVPPGQTIEQLWGAVAEFDLARGPALRLLLSVQADHCLVGLAAPAILADAAALTAVAREIALILRDRAPDLDPDPVQHADAAEWLHQQHPGSADHPVVAQPFDPAECMLRVPAEVETATLTAAFAAVAEVVEPDAGGVVLVDQGRDLPELASAVGVFVRPASAELFCAVHDLRGDKTVLLAGGTPGRFLLELSAVLRDGETVLTLRHDPTRIDQAHAERLLRRTASAVTRWGAGGAASPGCLLLPGEEQEIDTLATGAAVTSGGRLEDLFDARARQVPDRVAVVCGTDRLTYAELAAASDACAAGLLERGVEPDSLVGVLLPVGVQQVVAVLGAWKAGAGYLPLDPTHPVDRFTWQLADAGAALVITDAAGAALLAGARNRTGIFRIDRPASIRQPVTLPDRHEHGVAYAIYTSGSTGTPKAVLVEQRSVTHFAAAMRAAVFAGTERPLRVAQNAALTFDASVQQLVRLLDGDTLYLVDSAARRDDRELVGYLRRERINVVNGTPTQLAALVAAGLLDLDELALVLAAGEAMPADLWRRLGAAPATAFNIYGPTECTVNATATPIVGDRPSIGVPLPGYTVRVLDRQLRPCPVGGRGEIHISGPAVVRGYLGRPALTAQRFLPDPYGDGGTMYATGDLGVLRADGRIDFHGRIDDQVKLRGYRIEPGEIEHELRRHESVAEAAVVVRDERLLAYVTQATGGPPVQADRLREALTARLPDYLVPARFVALRTLPRGASGKLDRRALPEPPEDEPTTGFRAPRNATEETLAAVWARVLGVPQVGLDDNFFALGGDSIRAIRVRAQAEQQGVTFTVQQLLANQTVGQLASLARPVGTGQAGSPPAHSVEAHPLRIYQQQLMFRAGATVEERLFHNSRTAHLRGRLDIEALRAALRQTFDRHPTLRSIVDLDPAGSPRQVIRPQVEPELTIHDLTDLDPADQDAEIARFRGEQRQRPFFGTDSACLRFAVHRRSPGTFQFTVTIYEVLLDGLSVSLVLSEIFARYSAVLAGEPMPVTPPAATFADVVAAEQDALADPEQTAFWAEHLARFGAPTPLSWRDPAEPMARRTAVAPTNEHTAASLSRVADRLGVPVKALLIAVHLRVLAIAMGEPDAIGTSVFGNVRTEGPDGDLVIGQHLCTLPIRVPMTGGTWADLARTTHVAETTVFAHRRHPAPLLFGDAPVGHPVDTVVNVTRFRAYTDLFASELVEVIDDDFIECESIPLLTDFSIDPVTGTVRTILTCHGLSPVQVETLAGLYAECLGAVVADPFGVYRAVHRRELPATTLTRVDIAAQLTSHPSVAQVETPAEGVVLVTPRPGTTPTAAGLRRHLLGRVPNESIPDHILVAGTTEAEVVRLARECFPDLSLRDWHRSARVGPSWQRGVEFMQRVSVRFGVEAPVSWLCATPSPRALAELIDEARSENP